jgi:hypothetical protein
MAGSRFELEVGKNADAANRWSAFRVPIKQKIVVSITCAVPVSVGRGGRGALRTGAVRPCDRLHDIRAATKAAFLTAPKNENRDKIPLLDWLYPPRHRFARIKC